MAVDQKITDALSQLDADATDLTGSKGAADSALAALAAAQHTVDTTKSDVSSKSDKLTADKSALIQLIDTTYSV